VVKKRQLNRSNGVYDRWLFLELDKAKKIVKIKKKKKKEKNKKKW